jgi:hypothetical protein
MFRAWRSAMLHPLDVCARWLVGAQGSSHALRTGAGGLDRRSDAGVEPLSLAGAAAVRIISRALEKRAWAN